MTIRSESGPLSAASRMKISNACGGRPNPYGGAGIRAGSMPKGDRPIVLYPAYFDLGRTRHQGRRGAKPGGVETPPPPEVPTPAQNPRPPPEVGGGKRFPPRPRGEGGADPR